MKRTATPKRRDQRCLRCGTSLCMTDRSYDRELCLLLDEVRLAGNHVESWNDGAIAGAVLAGVDNDAYEAGLHARYDRAKKALADYQKGGK